MVSAATPGAAKAIELELQQDVALTKALSANYTLPVIIPGDLTLTLRGAAGEMRNLGLGTLPQLLYLRPGSTLVVDRLNMSDPADPQLGVWPDSVDTPTVIQSMPMWPTIGGDPGFTFDIRDANFTLHPTELCTPTVMAAQITALQQLAVSSGSNATDLYASGIQAFGVNWAAPMPVLSRATKVAMGTVLVSAKNSVLHCVLPDSSNSSDVVSVATAEELMAALADVAATSSGSHTHTEIELQNDVSLTPGFVALFSLPFVVPSHHTLTLRGADGALRSLDVGKTVGLVYFKTNSSLLLEHLNITGLADAQLGSWPDNVDSATVVQTMPLWPTLQTDAGASFAIRNSNVTMHPTSLCTPEAFGAWITAFEQLAVGAGSNATNIHANGTVGFVIDWAVPVPVLSSTTRVAIGTVYVEAQNTTIYCTKPGGQDGVFPLPPLDGSSSGEGSSGTDSSSTNSAGSEAGGGTAGWVWAVVGVAVALAVAAVVVALLWRRRFKHRGRQELVGVKVHDAADGGSKIGSQSVKLGSEGAGSNPQSPATSGFMDQLLGTRGSLPEGAWKSRVGFIEGLQLGGLIGRGGYARVYKGRWKGTTVAVKVVETHVGPQQQYDLRNEPLLSLSLSHPNVLQGFKMCAVRILTDSSLNGRNGVNKNALLQNGSNGHLANSTGSHGPATGLAQSGSEDSIGSVSGGMIVPHLINANCWVEVMPPDAVLQPGIYEMWLVSELADRGTLADAMTAGWFGQEEPPGRNMPIILLCLLDLARGLEYLHNCSIVHGDLKPQNVLLRSAATDRRGYVCKLGDFGLSRMLPDTATHVNTGSYGTVTHAAPELLSEGRLTRASDVFAFGTVLWELVTGQKLFPDMNHMQILIQVTQRDYRPPIPADFPQPLADLLRGCWDTHPQARPDAETIVRELIEFAAAFNLPEAQKKETAATADGGAAKSPAAVPASAAFANAVAACGATGAVVSPFARHAVTPI